MDKPHSSEVVSSNGQYPVNQAQPSTEPHPVADPTPTDQLSQVNEPLPPPNIEISQDTPTQHNIDTPTQHNINTHTGEEPMNQQHHDMVPDTVHDTVPDTARDTAPDTARDMVHNNVQVPKSGVHDTSSSDLTHPDIQRLVTKSQDAKSRDTPTSTKLRDNKPVSYNNSNNNNNYY